MRRQLGFTLIELMIVVAIIAIIASIAIPNLLSARLNANDTSTIATLRNISSAQAQFQATAKADADWDGMGEFGAFQELSGAIAVRNGPMGVLAPPVLSAAFRAPNVSGEISKAGYFLKMYLPSAAGTGVCPDELGNFATVDSGLAETTWCCYAWPVNYGNSGVRSFMVNQTGDIVATDVQAYSGTAAVIPIHAAFLTSAVDSITGLTAIGAVGGDGNMWTSVN